VVATRRDRVGRRIRRGWREGVKYHAAPKERNRRNPGASFQGESAPRGHERANTDTKLHYRGESYMIDVHVHLRGEPPERRALAALPVVGTYIIDGAERRLWRVETVVLDGEAVNVYAVQVSPRLAAELTAAWAGWGDPVELPEGPNGDTPTQRHLEGFAA